MHNVTTKFGDIARYNSIVGLVHDLDQFAEGKHLTEIAEEDDDDEDDDEDDIHDIAHIYLHNERVEDLYRAGMTMEEAKRVASAARNERTLLNNERIDRADKVLPKVRRYDSFPSANIDEDLTELD